MDGNLGLQRLCFPSPLEILSLWERIKPSRGKEGGETERGGLPGTESPHTGVRAPVSSQ